MCNEIVPTLLAILVGVESVALVLYRNARMYSRQPW